MRAAILREMGLAPLWKLRDRPGDEFLCAASPEEASSVQAVAERSSPPRETEPLVVRPAPSERVSPAVPLRAPIMPKLEALGTDSGVVARSEVASLGWDELQQKVLACQACPLCKRRRQAVFGVGDRQADWLVVGEGPGAEEDEKGEPFVGEAGKLLDAMLYAIGLVRGQNVYIANTVKCRPPGNRTPEPSEMATCFPYLEQQIALIRPKLIVAVGRPAAQTLLGTEVKIGEVRGKRLEYRGIPLIVTYHPAYLLRNLAHKSLAWDDLCFIRRTMERLAAG